MVVAETDASETAEKLVATKTRRQKGTENNQLKATTATATVKATATGRQQTGIVKNQLNVVMTAVTITSINNKGSEYNSGSSCGGGGSGSRGRGGGGGGERC